MNIFKELSDNVKINEITQQDINDGKLKIFQNIDSPMNKQNEAMWNFNYMVTDEMRQERRNQLLNLTIDDVANVWEKYLPAKGQYQEVIVGDIPAESGDHVIDIVNA